MMDSLHVFARIEAAVAANPAYRFVRPVDWTIDRGESWALVGPNGAGKSLLIGMLTRRIALKQGSVSVADPRGAASIRSIEFRDIHPPAECRNMYYQQRWNTTETQVSPSVREWFGASAADSGFGDDLFDIASLADRRIISLSSGELRKLLVAGALRENPRMLALDNPFIGLDAPSRTLLDGILLRLVREKGLSCVLAVSDPNDVPRWIDRVLPVGPMEVFPPMERDDFFRDKTLQERLFGPLRSDRPPVFDLPSAGAEGPDFSLAVQMNDVGVAYGTHTILRGVDWTVRRGEKWALVGANGSGKSTLLSLISGDNPQAYANRIVLFDRQRGTGESIWDIKRRIGYVSPEMHTYYLEPIPCEQVAASGFFDSIGLYRRCTPEQAAAARQWLRALGAEDLADKSFLQISYGQQRLVLLARALVKDPDLLILDEPFHGLDAGKKRLAKAVIEQSARRGRKTLLFVSHYRDEIPDCVDRILDLNIPSR